MLLRKRARLNKNKIILDKIKIGKDEALLLRYPTNEDGQILYPLEVIQNVHNAFRNRFGKRNVITVPDKWSFSTIKQMINKENEN